MYLPWDASKARLREAENARQNRAEIVKALSHGKVTRRDLIKWGLLTAGGALAMKNGLSPYARSGFASSNIPTGAPPSPLFGIQAFTQPMPRFDLLPRNAVSSLNPAPREKAYTPQDYADAPLQPVPAVLGGGVGPLEGRPPGADWAHQRFDVFPPRVAVEVSQEGAKVNSSYDPGSRRV